MCVGSKARDSNFGRYMARAHTRLLLDLRRTVGSAAASCGHGRGAAGVQADGAGSLPAARNPTGCARAAAAAAAAAAAEAHDCSLEENFGSATAHECFRAAQPQPSAEVGG